MVKKEILLIAEHYLTLVKEFLDVEDAYLFGSHAHGSPREDSDIDIGIFTNKMPSDYFSVLKKLYSTRRKVNTLIEPHLLVSTKDNSGFDAEVRKGVRLH